MLKLREFQSIKETRFIESFLFLHQLKGLEIDLSSISFIDALLQVDCDLEELTVGTFSPNLIEHAMITQLSQKFKYLRNILDQRHTSQDVKFEFHFRQKRFFSYL